MSKLIVSITSDRALGGIANSLKTYSKAMALAGIEHTIIISNSAPALDELEKMRNVNLIIIPTFFMRLHILTRFCFPSQNSTSNGASKRHLSAQWKTRQTN